MERDVVANLYCFALDWPGHLDKVAIVYPIRYDGYFTSQAVNARCLEHQQFAVR